MGNAPAAARGFPDLAILINPLNLQDLFVFKYCPKGCAGRLVLCKIEQSGKKRSMVF